MEMGGTLRVRMSLAQTRVNPSEANVFVGRIQNGFKRAIAEGFGFLAREV